MKKYSDFKTLILNQKIKEVERLDEALNQKIKEVEKLDVALNQVRLAQKVMIAISGLFVVWCGICISK